MATSAVHRYYVGFSFKQIGTFKLTIDSDADGKSYTVEKSSGRHYHHLNDTAASTNPGNHTSWKSQLQSDLNSAASSAGSTVTWTVDWDNSTLQYTLTPSTGTFDATLNPVAQDVLGLPSTLTGESSKASTVRPYYVIATARGALSNARGNHEPNNIVAQVVSDAGVPSDIGPTKRPKIDEWQQMFEPHAVTHKFAAEIDKPWTWEHLFEHCIGEPIVLVGHSNTAVAYGSAHVIMRFRLRGGRGLSFRPEPAIPNRHTKWNIPFEVYVLERFVGDASVPADAILDESGAAILDETGAFVLDEGA